MKIKSKGQYFTPSFIASFMVSFISHDTSAPILEPSAGQGVFLKSLYDHGFQNLTAIELDNSLTNVSDIPIIYKDFFDYSIENKFDIIIGNPPYIRWKNQSKDQRKKLIERTFWGKRMNGLTDILQPFIFKSVDHLNPEGELIFITPKFWIQTLHSRPLRHFLSNQGQITHYIDLNERKVFQGVSLNLIIFKFVKNSLSTPVKVLRYLSKKKVTQAELIESRKVVDSLDVSDLNAFIKTENCNSFVTNPPINDNKWFFIPERELLSLEKLEKKCYQSYKISCKIKTKKTSILLDQLMNKRDLSQKRINEKDCEIVILNKKKFYLPRHNSDKIDPNYNRMICLGDIFEIGNGMVSGLDKAFQLKFFDKLNEEEKKSVIKVIKAKSLRQYYSEGPNSYFFINSGSIEKEEEFKEIYPYFYSLLFPFIEKLEKRWTPYPLPYWEWAFPRNKKLIENNDEKVFVPCKERFDSRGYVRFSYCKGNYYASQDVTILVKFPWIKESIEYFVAYLNSDIVFQWLKNKGLRRGGVLEFSEKPLSEIPIRLINWNDSKEKTIYNNIIRKIQIIIEQKNEINSLNEKKQIEQLFLELCD
ncbi:MAG: Eco57I restriction-modification methylase domain-containing protein [Candidatus Hodarchaeales archaeon]